MRFLLSIHDVWPGNFPRVQAHLRRLRSLGARRVALLVVPEYHGRGNLGAAPEFVAWLKEKAGSGSEILLHGCRHLAAERLPGASRDGGGRRGLWGRWVNAALVDGEAEFCGLPAGEAAGLLDRGADVLRSAGFAALGFVAPTWHGSPPIAALSAQGFVLRESRFFLRHLPTGAARFAPPLAWIRPGPGARLAGGRAWLEAALRLPLIKVALHPGDLESDAAAAAVERVLAAGSESAYGEIFPAAREVAATRP
jgi:hypothetical protein